MDRDYKPLSSKFHRIRNSFRSVVRRGSKYKSSTSVDPPIPSSVKTAGSLSSGGSTTNIGKKSKGSFFGGKNHV